MKRKIYYRAYIQSRENGNTRAKARSDAEQAIAEYESKESTVANYKQEAKAEWQLFDKSK